MIEFLSQFHFLRPWWLLAVLPVAALIYLLARRDSDRTRWQQAVDAELLPHLLEGMGERGARIVRTLYEAFQTRCFDPPGSRPDILPGFRDLLLFLPAGNFE